MFLFALTSSPLKAETTYEYQPYIVHTDHLGTPLRLTNDSGAVVWAAEYETFGKVASLDEDVDQDGTSVTLNFRFPGQYYDTESGLYYNWNRYYDPEVGRYLQSENHAIYSRQSLINLSSLAYVYSFNNPVAIVDISGLYAYLLIWHGYGMGNSAAGHVSIVINGASYSFPGGDLMHATIGAAEPIASYFKTQPSDRQVSLYEFNFSSNESKSHNITEEDLQQYLDNYIADNANKPFSLWTFNCGTPLRNYIYSKYPWYYWWFHPDLGLLPCTLGETLDNMDLVKYLKTDMLGTNGAANIGRGAHHDIRLDLPIIR